jgi:hypothetical protein
VTDTGETLRTDLRRLALRSLVAGAVGALACLVGALVAPEAFFPAYLAVYHYVLGFGLGCLMLLMIYHLTGGAWGFLLRRILEAGARTLPILAILFLPIVVGLRHLFPWAQPELAESLRVLEHQRRYMNLPLFLVRAVAYFAVWCGLAIVLSRWSRQQDQGTDPGIERRLGALSAAGLIAVALTLQFMSVDWLMALQPAFRSTIFGPLMGSAQVLSAHALVLIVLALLLPRTPLGEYAAPDALNDLGNLLLTFLVVFAYMVYFQYMLVWIANLRHEAAWFLPRTQGFWGVVALVLIVLHLGVPFFLLLMRDVKRNPQALAAVSGLILIAHLVYQFQQILPAFDVPTFAHWVNAAAVVAIGGLWLADFLWELGRLSPVALNDPSRATALHLLREAEEERGVPEEAIHA